ncbi:HIRA-interacting protein 3-like [Oscarella lobularis]|uniref:HIRA-interacting protein 3-like n=1 Tax=Oscarella lobularis TaxID=121494 RepID=UPI0033134A89
MKSPYVFNMAAEDTIRRFVAKQFENDDSGDLTLRILKSRLAQHLDVENLDDDVEMHLRAVVDDMTELENDDEPDEEDEETKKPIKIKAKTKKKSSDVKKKTETLKKEEESDEVKRLKRMILACGMRRPYKRLFADCKSEKEKARILKKILEEAGIEGRPTLEKCRELKTKKEEKEELDALDTGNIIATPKGSRRSRRSDSSTGARKRLADDSDDEESNTRINKIIRSIASSDSDSDQ